MILLIILFTVVLLGLLPLLLQHIAPRLPLVNDVVLCFLVGGLISHFLRWNGSDQIGIATSFSVAKTILSISVILAIPMLLLSSDVRQLGQQTSRYLLSFGTCVTAVLIAAIGTAFLFPDLPDLATATGGLVGVYIGGTPNLVAILYALRAPEPLFVTLNATDTFCSGLYFWALVSIAKTVYGWVLPQKAMVPQTDILDSQWETTIEQEPEIVWNRSTYQSLAKAMGLTLVSILCAVGVALYLFPTSQGTLNELVLMLTLSTMSIGLSLLLHVDKRDAIYAFAQYLLLIFAFALGYLVDFSALLETGTSYLVFNSILLVLVLVIHLIIARLLGIDVDLFIITTTACIMGPPFVGPVCRALHNKTLLAPGMALSVLGLMVGTYFGIGIALYLPI